MTQDFTSRVLMVVRSIPPGRVASYGEVAAYAGRPGAARAVGNIMRDCHRPDIPCHRVIAAGGHLGGYGGHESLKRALLLAEGITVVGRRVKDYAAISGLPRARAKAGRKSKRETSGKMGSARRGKAAQRPR